MNAFAKLIATAGGVGYSPVAPGTCGTLVALPLAWALSDVPWWGFIVIVVALTAAAIWAADVADVAWGTHDSGRVVADEVVGFLATVTFVDRADPYVLGIAFLLFRGLDIVKPWPIRWFDDELPGGFGVVLDDVAAGVIGAAVMVGLAEAGAFEALAALWSRA